MEDNQEIVNRVAGSALEVFDLEDFYPEGKRISIDLAQWLSDGMILREKDFRAQLNAHNWNQYQESYVAVHCSADAIIPAWASMLVVLQAAPFAKSIIQGSITDLENALYQQILPSIDYTIYKDKPVIIKGCSKKPVPMGAYVLAAQYLQPFASSIMYGEACSAVPLYKKRKG